MLNYILHQIVLCLPLPDVTKMTQTCKKWYKVQQLNHSWKFLLKRDFLVAYDIAVIEKENFNDAYKFQKSDVSSEELYQIGRKIILNDNKTTNIIILRDGVKYIQRSLSKAPQNLQYCADIIDIQSEISKISGDFGKLELYVNLFMTYKTQDYHVLYAIGFALQHQLKRYEEALMYYEIALKTKHIASFRCFIEGLHCLYNDNCVKNETTLRQWCQNALVYFPTRKYIISYCLADRISSKPEIIQLVQESLYEHDQFNGDNLIIIKCQDVTKTTNLTLLACTFFRMNQYTESLKYWNLALDAINDETSQEDKFRIHINILDIYAKGLVQLDADLYTIFKFMFALELSETQYEICFNILLIMFENDLKQLKFEKISRFCSIFLKLKTQKNISQKIIQGVYGLLCICHYYECNFGQGVSAGLLAMNEKNTASREARYLGKCYIKTAEFSKAYEIFESYALENRNFVILLEFALFYLEDSSYYNLEVANDNFLESQKYALESTKTKPFDYEYNLKMFHSKVGSYKRQKIY